MNGGNNLTGGAHVDQWMAVPPLVVDTQPFTHPQDEWAGFVNVPATLMEGASALVAQC
jgi:hypothetical protein